jgi:hypothetical protein
MASAMPENGGENHGFSRCVFTGAEARIDVALVHGTAKSRALIQRGMRDGLIAARDRN